MSDDNRQSLSDEVRDIWNANAGFWDDYMGEGNDFQRLLIGPAAERLLGRVDGRMVLELACGNGNFSRRLAALGARVLACDFSEVFVQRARARTTQYADRIEYRIVDATDRDQLLALGPQRFDAAVCNMALMDMLAVDPLFQALPTLLKPGGHFVFSVAHPCFNSVYTTKIVEEDDLDGALVERHAVKILGYATPRSQKGLGVIGQPKPHIYFHRAISDLFNACFRAGFTLDGMEEPTFDEAAKPSRPFAWANYKDIPPVLMARMRLAAVSL